MSNIAIFETGSDKSLLPVLPPTRTVSTIQTEVLSNVQHGAAGLANYGKMSRRVTFQRSAHCSPDPKLDRIYRN
jgi:hypothetical protein